MHQSLEIKNLKKRLRKARQFPHNTCPASRHVQIMADRLSSKAGSYSMLQDEPVHCAQSLYATVAALYEARTKLHKLAAALYAGDDSKKNLKLAHEVLKSAGWPHDKQSRDIPNAIK